MPNDRYTLQQALQLAGFQWDTNLQAWYRLNYQQGSDTAQIEAIRTPGIRIDIPIHQLEQPDLGHQIKADFDAMFTPENAVHVNADSGRYLPDILNDIRTAIINGYPVVAHRQPDTTPTP